MPHFSEERYFPEKHPKDLIILHHTVGASAISTIDAWKANHRRIGTAYVVERDGTVHQVFPSECWAYHVGVKGDRSLDKRSIGIEIASEGPLLEQNGKFYAFGRVSKRAEYRGPVFTPAQPFRGHRHFAAYTPAAITATCELVEHLLSLYSIPRQTPTDHTSASVAYRTYQGVLSHAQLRADKSDVHPGFDWPQLIARCNLATTANVKAAAAS